MTGVQSCQPEAAAPYQHVCPDGGCIYLGQPSFRGCGCHKTREQMMLARIEELIAVAKMAKAAAEMELGIAAAPDFAPREMLDAADRALAMPLERSGGAT